MPASARHQAIDCSGSSQVEKATGGLPCLRREKRSSTAAATVTPSTTRAAAGSWKTALIPRMFTQRRLSEKRFLRNRRYGQIGDRAPSRRGRETEKEGFSRCARPPCAVARAHGGSAGRRAS